MRQLGAEQLMDAAHRRNSRQSWSGRPWLELKAEMAAARGDDPAKWEDARSFGMVYPASPEVEQVIREAQAMFVAENGRHTEAFPSLRRFESEILAMTADLFSAREPIGNVLSGGTEAAVVVLKTVRDQARAERRPRGRRNSSRRRPPTPSTRWRRITSASLSFRSASMSTTAPISTRCSGPSRNEPS